MIKVTEILRISLALISLYALVVSAQIPLHAPLAPDRLISIEYVLTGVNGGYPVQTLNVSGTLPLFGTGSGEAVLKTSEFNSSTTKRLPLTDAELRALDKLFSDNGFSTLDSVYQSGCLSCPDFSITNGAKTVRGNTTGGSAGLANIKTALDALVKKVQDATPAASSRDTVIFEPAKPTNLDDITFKLFNYSNCCVTKYYKQIVTAGDTAIYLSYEYDDSSCMYVKCLAPGSWASFLSKPIPAGKYSVYKVASIYCPPGRPCPLIMAVPEYVGPLTVLKSAVGLSPRSIPEATKIPQLLINGADVRLVLDKGGPVEIRAFGLDGSLLGTVFKGFGPEGTSIHSLGSFTSGAGHAMIVTLTTSNRTVSRTVFCHGNSIR